MKGIISRVQQVHSEKFQSPFLTVFSPGRINFIGEHTDYNLGFVLPASIDKGIVVTVSKSVNDISEIYSIDKNELIKVDVRQPLRKSDHGWANYVLGVVDQLNKSGNEVGNFNCVFGGDIPIGSGLSSSAALENGIAFSLNTLFGLGLDRMKLLHLSQKAEHEFVGVMCGIMDQFSSMMGRKDFVMKLDCRNLEHHFYPAEFGDYQIILLNSNVSHNLASSEYNIRRKQCEEGVSIIDEDYPEVKSLRDLTHSMLAASKAKLPEVVYLRCKYIIDENQRVGDFVKALEKRDFLKCGKILFAAHQAMKTEYEITCPEIDLLVDFAKEQPGVIGSRMMGGGFGGCTLNLVKKDNADVFIDSVREAYLKKTGIELSPYYISVEKGVHLVNDSVFKDAF